MSHSARIWNYWLGGTDNFAVDWEVDDRVAEMLPIIVIQARADRAFGARQLSRRQPLHQRRQRRGPLSGQPPPVDEFCGIARKP